MPLFNIQFLWMSDNLNCYLIILANSNLLLSAYDTKLPYGGCSSVGVNNSSLDWAYANVSA